MTDSVDIIYANPIDRYVELVYNGADLISVRFINSKERLTEKKTRQASFELDEYFKGERTDFSCGFDISVLSSFSRKVLFETSKIGYGEMTTYSELAGSIGTKAFRAVGRALADNPIPIIIPCHRVVAKSGIGGYSAGVDIKTRVLEHEAKTRIANNL